LKKINIEKKEKERDRKRERERGKQIGKQGLVKFCDDDVYLEMT
jgi:hypothetical protein